MANPGHARAFICVTSVLTRGDLRKGSPSVPASAGTLLPTFPSSPCLQPARQAAALFGDANIHTLLEPQIKGGVPRPASQWSLCADGSQRGVRTQAEGVGLGKGAQHKDTCLPQKPEDDEVKSGARWRMHPSSPLEDANGEFSVLRGRKRGPCVCFPWKGQNGWVHEQRPPSALAGGGCDVGESRGER